ncbi:MAG: hypothetical protein COY66_00650 [Candidatus Kerfeldbacteria bacterium CG_4_10_14_0_8_um_filter_42_10]|uniref:Glycosyltransferase 2-like domain-containing protein n=1 Tax=Candidatus Kerfeldbacteria bacterium CG_4_10_14_0_8_um_filter_42_10 TaxID=2014248 RepID=A0A2M7RKF3_9BACT|nr:MAG: hypothetical protein COY66_00650 [Candidatus Kerfeldbacteria bacterium CG_4_10_14_0_8_um_filter_42_10]
MIECTIGIMAFNEEKNIGKLLNALLRQKLKEVEIKKIVVVASGCTDQTAEIAKQYTERYPQIELVTQAKREGKSSAINLFLKTVKTPVVVLESADTLPLFYTIENLVTPFSDPAVGMCGGHPLPQNNPDSFLGFTNHLLWTLHHLLSLERPKMGELVAFRTIIPSIPVESAVDETSIESFFFQRKMQILYLPKAMVLNKGAETVSDFLKQRRRIYAGHLYIKHHHHYQVTTLHATKIMGLILKNVRLSFKTVFWLFSAILLEAAGRYLGVFDYYVKKKNHSIWAMADSTKNLTDVKN